MADCSNYLQEDIATLILQDVNEIIHEARSRALDKTIGGIHDPRELDRIIAVAPHQVVKGTLKALYQHVGGMYQNLIYGSEIYPDEVGFAGAFRDIIAEHIRGQEPWLVRPPTPADPPQQPTG